MLSLISTIVLLVVFAFFAGFNLDNKCSINLLFYQFADVPIFLTIIISFLVGAIFAVIVVLFFKGKSFLGDATAIRQKSIFSKRERHSKAKNVTSEAQNSSADTVVADDSTKGVGDESSK